MKVSILTITKRAGGLDVLAAAIAAQDCLADLKATNDVEWILVDEHAFNKTRSEEMNLLCAVLGFPVTHTYPENYDPPRYGKLCRASNWGLQRCQGDLIFFLNDLLYAPPNALSRFLRFQDASDHLLLQTGVNHRTHVPTLDQVHPEYREHPEDFPYSFFKEDFDPRALGFPNVPCFWIDPRSQGWVDREPTTDPIMWEANVAMAPRLLLEAAGGWDEELDRGYAFDNIDLALRCLQTDREARIVIDRKVISISLDHQQYIQDPPKMPEACERNRKIVVKRLDAWTAEKEAEVRRPEIKLVGYPNGNAEDPRTYPHQLAAVREERQTATPRKKYPPVAFYLPDIGGWGAIDPDAPFAHALGGRETATVRLAQELNKLGWNVDLYTQTAREGFDKTGVCWALPPQNVRALSSYDVLVSVERPDIFARARAKLNILHAQCAHPQPGHGIGVLDAKIDQYFFLSNFQRWSMRNADPNIDPMKVINFGNGIDLERYATPGQRVPGRLTWSSSPDRGLHHLLRMWPELKHKHPELSLRVFYNIAAIEAFRWAHEERAEWCRQIAEGMYYDGVEFIGPVDQMTLAKEQAQEDIFVYPCDPVIATETSCISVIERLAAGTPMILSPVDCLYELYQPVAHFSAVPVDDANWIDNITVLLRDEEERAAYTAKGKAYAAFYTWEKIAQRWSDFLLERLDLSANEGAAVEFCEDTQDRLQRELGMALVAATG